MNIEILKLAAGYKEGFRFAKEDLDIEKFAELIILQCCDLTRNWSNDDYSIDITKDFLELKLEKKNDTSNHYGRQR